MAERGVLGCTVATLPQNRAYLPHVPTRFQHPHVPGSQVIMRDRRYDSILIVGIECVLPLLPQPPFAFPETREQATGLPRSTDAICDMRDIRYRNQPGPWHRLLRRVALPLRLIAGDGSQESVDYRP